MSPVDSTPTATSPTIADPLAATSAATSEAFAAIASHTSSRAPEVVEERRKASGSSVPTGRDDGGDDRATLTDAVEPQKEAAGDDPDGKAEMPELKTHHSNGLVDQTAYLPPKYARYGKLVKQEERLADSALPSLSHFALAVPRQIIVVFLALTLVIFLSFLDQTIVSTALPNSASC